MEDNLAVCASAFIRNKGKTVFTENDFLMGVSMDYHWMSYTDSKAVLSAMVAEGLFEKQGEVIRAVFSAGDVDVPVAYKPSAELIESVRAGAKKPAAAPAEKKPEPENVPAPQSDKPEDIMPVLMGIADANGVARRDFMMKSNALQRSLGIYIEVAGLYVLRDMGIDVSGLTERVYRSVSLK